MDFRSERDLGAPRDADRVGSSLLRHKTARPRLTRVVARERLAEKATAHVVVLQAPSGYGKTVLAAQLADDGLGPVAWFSADATDRDTVGVVAYVLSALAGAWPDLAGLAGTAGGFPGTAQISYLLGELAGPGTIVLDDLDVLDEETSRPLLHTLTKALPPGVRLVVCSKEDVPLDLLRLRAAGSAVVLDASDLRFDVDEIAALIGDGESAERVHELTGGWPLAVGLAAEGVRAGRGPMNEADRDALAAHAVRGLHHGAVTGLAVLAVAPHTTPAVVTAVAADHADDLCAFAARHPSLVTRDGADRWVFHDLLRDHLRHRPVPARSLAVLASALSEEDPLAALRVQLDAGLWADAAHTVEAARDSLAAQGRWQLLIDLVAELPAAYRTPAIRLAAATSASVLLQTSAAELAALWADLVASGGPVALYAGGLYARHLLLEGQGLAGAAVAIQSLADIGCSVFDPDAAAPAIARLDTASAKPAAWLLQTLGIALFFTGRREDRGDARRILKLAKGAQDRAGMDQATTVVTGTYVEAVSGAVSVESAVAEMEAAIAVLRRVDNAFTPWALLMLADARTTVRDPARMRADVREARSWAEGRAGPAFERSARGIEICAGLLTGDDPARDDGEAEALWRDHVEHDSTTSQEFACQVGHLLADLGRFDLAKAWEGRARVSRLMNPYTAWDREGLTIRLRLARGEAGEALDALDEVLARDDVAGLDTGAALLAARVTCDLAGTPAAPEACRRLQERATFLPGAWLRRLRGTDDPATDASGTPGVFEARDAISVRVLGPEIAVVVGDAPRAVPRGFAARLLALLVAADGVLGAERAIDELWPDADPDSGRNRLYIVVHRLRRSLGLDADGPLKCEDGLLRLERGSGVTVDAWEFTAAASAGRLGDAVDLYSGEFCSRQFAYEDFALEARRELHGRFLTAARRMLEDHVAAGRTAEAATLARRLWEADPEDETGCLAAVTALAGAGHRGEALRILEDSATRLRDLGLPADDLVSHGRRVLAAAG